VWASRRADLGVEESLLGAERSFLSRAVGSLTEDDLDDLHGRASGALVFGWALGRIPDRPSFATVEALATALAAHGLLGDGSIARARAAAEGSTLRSSTELLDALSAYRARRGKAREVDEPDRVFAEVAADHLLWILDPEADLEEDEVDGG